MPVGSPRFTDTVHPRQPVLRGGRRSDWRKAAARSSAGMPEPLRYGLSVGFVLACSFVFIGGRERACVCVLLESLFLLFYIVSP